MSKSESCGGTSGGKPGETKKTVALQMAYFRRHREKKDTELTGKLIKTAKEGGMNKLRNKEVGMLEIKGLSSKVNDWEKWV